METTGKRIKELRNEKKMTQENLGKLLGIEQSAVRKYEYNEVDIPKSKLERLSDIFEVSTDYLLGKTDFKTSEDRQRKWNYFDETSDPDGTLNKKVEIIEKVLAKIIPFHGEVSAGYGEWLEDGHEYELIPFEDVPEGTDFALCVRGDSMEPLYSDGDIVFVKQNVNVQYPQTGVYILNGEGYLKIYEGNKLISLNQKYEPISINEHDSFLCVGRVIGKTRI